MYTIEQLEHIIDKATRGENNPAETHIVRICEEYIEAIKTLHHLGIYAF